MRRFTINFLRNKTWYLLGLSFLIGFLSTSYSQNSMAKSDQYLIGEEEKLEMIVHIWGEVNRPGEYRVKDDTNVLELISKAGGPTEFSNLSEVILTREGVPHPQLSSSELNPGLLASKDKVSQLDLSEPSKNFQKRVIKINLKEYLEKENYDALPKLQPGDVLRIKRNSWFKWRTAILLISQIAFVFQAMYYFSRIDY